MRRALAVLVVVAGCGNDAGPPPADADPGFGNPYPQLQSIEPAVIPAGAPATTVALTGANFAADAVIVVDGVARAPATAAPEALTFDLSVDELLLPAVLEIAVVNPGPGGGVSRAVAVRVIEPNRPPTIVSIAPDHVDEGDPGFELTVTGADFLAGSVVRWNGADRPTTFVAETELRAQIAAADVAVASTAMVDVVNPGPGGGPSATTRPFFVFGASTGIGVVERVSVSDAGAELTNDSDYSAVSANGRYVAWKSNATGIVAGDTNGAYDAFVRDTCRSAPPGCVPTTVRASLDADGSEPMAGDVEQVIGSASGRYVGFRASFPPMVPGAEVDSAYVRDTCLGAPPGCVPQTVAGSVTEVETFDMSDDGRYVAFLAFQRLLPEDQVDMGYDVYVRDTCLGQTACTPSLSLVTVDGTGAAVGETFAVSISSTGRYVAFQSWSSALVAGDTNGRPDIFVRDTCLGAPSGCVPQVVRASVDTAGAGGPGDSYTPSIDPGGRYVAFMSFNVLAAGGGPSGDFYLRDTCLGTTACTPSTLLVSVMQAGGGAGNCRTIGPRAVADGGRYVVFVSSTDGIDPRDTNGEVDVYVRDLCLGAPGCTPSTVLLSINAEGDAGDAGSGFNTGVGISRDGRFASFYSSATNLIPNDTNGEDDVFLAATGF
jgi:hypothetical protein